MNEEPQGRSLYDKLLFSLHFFVFYYRKYILL